MQISEKYELDINETWQEYELIKLIFNDIVIYELSAEQHACLLSFWNSKIWSWWGGAVVGLVRLR